MQDELAWNLDRQGDTTRVTLRGALTEHAELAKLAADLASSAVIDFDLGSVARINSCGVREWLEFMRTLPAAETRFQNCSTAVVHQINLIHGFTGRAKVCSIRVPLVCDHCGHSEAPLIAVERGTIPPLSHQSCPKCKHPMVLDDLAETYFAFLLR